MNALEKYKIEKKLAEDITNTLMINGWGHAADIVKWMFERRWENKTWEEDVKG